MDDASEPPTSGHHPAPGPASAEATAAARLLAGQAAATIAECSGVPRHEIAIVLGSGWGRVIDRLGRTTAQLDARDVAGFHPSGVAGHQSTLRSVEVSGTGAHALVLGARTHLYEGYGTDAVAHGVRTAAAAGARTVLLTNGCGSLRPQWGPGTVVLLRDHLNLTGTSTLRGPSFIDMTEAYSVRLRRLAHEVAPGLPEGVYAQFRGPQYETPAEIHMAELLGAELVGMSTALETVAAREAGLDVLGLSLVTNLAAGIGDQPLAHDDVVAAGQAAAPRLGALLESVVRRVLQ